MMAEAGKCRHGNPPPCKDCIKEYQEEHYN